MGVHGSLLSSAVHERAKEDKKNNKDWPMQKEIRLTFLLTMTNMCLHTSV